MAVGAGVQTALHRTTAEGGPTAWILSYTGVSDEPRVRRQAKTLTDAGWRVVVAGFDGRSPRPPEWSYIRLGNLGRRAQPWRLPLRVVSRQIGRALYRFGPPTPAQFGARLYARGLQTWRTNHVAIMRAWKANPSLTPDLVVAHDYPTCPPAAALAAATGAAFVVECHDYARAENPHDPRWVRDTRHFITALQDYYLARADAVTTVSDGIARLLDAEQALQRPCVTVRSLPFRQAMNYRPVGSTINVLYHGLVTFERGLKETIVSVQDWRPEYHLTIRGDGPSEFVEHLKTTARAAGVAERVRFEAPVPFDEIVGAANRADIGIFVQGDSSPQKRLVLPNKFFEYIMAGLALCVSELREMAALVRSYNLGVLVPKLTPPAIANAINSLTPARIAEFKRASLAAAEVLNWETEQSIMLALFEELVTRRRGLRRQS